MFRGLLNHRSKVNFGLRYKRYHIKATLSQTNYVEVDWNDGKCSKFHYVWLWDNCPRNKEPSSQQKMNSLIDAPLDIIPLKIESDPLGSTMHVVWEEGNVSSFPANWLRDHTYSNPALNEARRQALFTWDKEKLTKHSLSTFTYQELMEDEKKVWEWAKVLSSVGLSKVSGVPPDEEGLKAVASRLGRLKVTMYPLVDHVYYQPSPSNVAYTSVRLEPHMDLCYYEAVPGFQFLHCAEYKTTGGQNFFVDGFMAAEYLRMLNPSAFQLLTHTKTTFQKIDKENHRIYRSPPITIDQTGQIVGINYSPQFEGPLQIPFDSVMEYYGAMKSWIQIIRHPDLAYSLQLGEGDMVAFNNRRVLHAREAFAPEGTRRILTCYVDTDEFSSTWRLMGRRYEEGLMLPRIGDYTFWGDSVST
eukprot:TRINITY_DN22329_c0_g5_i1.p1 TRINITY_DN22329_c0_g5~~TRINITY_DN22329_c0_g5_i1.p1  ORF type:complete len:415 (-),score=61.37 TRINITY_DN22329_c0_g5_i1:4-1248(-)